MRTSIIQSLSLCAFAALLAIAGCDRRAADLPRSSHQAVEESSDGEVTLEEIAAILDEAETLTPPEPVIELPSPDGWMRSEPASLPTDDHGFTVGYEHPSGPSVTLYQFTRSRTSISDDLQGPDVVNELNRAKTGINQLVELGAWESATERDSGVVNLGDSPRKALWSRYDLRADGQDVVSEIYVWVYNNTFFKIRSSSHAATERETFKSLLTALGEACAKP